MSVDHLRYRWWLDGEGHPWIRHDCLDDDIDIFRLPPPWRLTPDGGISDSFHCVVCGAHTILTAVDQIDPPQDFAP